MDGSSDPLSDPRWHDAQQGGYAEDLPIWLDLARQAIPGPVLELGAGTGRVAIPVAAAARTARVFALDRDPVLLGSLWQRAVNAGLHITTVCEDATSFETPARFRLIYAPTSFVQIVGGRDERLAVLASIRRHLRDDGMAALSVMELGTITAADNDPYIVRADGRLYEATITRVDWLADDVSRITWSRATRRAWRPMTWRRVPPVSVEYRELTADDIERDCATVGLELTERRDLPHSDWAPATVYVLRPVKVGVGSL